MERFTMVRHTDHEHCGLESDPNGPYVTFKDYEARIAELERVDHQRIAEIMAQESRADRLRKALVGLIGAETREELEQMEISMRLMPAPDADKAAAINAIHALLESL